MISKRKLIKYRREALLHKELQEVMPSHGVLAAKTDSLEYINKILELTQELIDQHLMKTK